MTNIIKILSLTITIVICFNCPAIAARDTNTYDGNIFPIYAGNGSIVPPKTSLKQSINEGKVSVIFFYLDDSADSKKMAPTISSLDLIWGNNINILGYTTDLIQNNKQSDSPEESSYYWSGLIPQTVIINKDGELVFDKNGQVSINELNKVISESTGINKNGENYSIESYNEYNSELSDSEYNKPRK